MISSAYNYYLAQYGASRENSRYTTHKKSELRNIYNSMVKSNRRSPLYKIEEPDEASKYAIDLKEASAALIDVADSISDNNAGRSGFASRQAASSDESIATAKYIGNGTENITEYDITIKGYAGSQENISYYLVNDESVLRQGEYSFDLNIGEYSYEFQFSVNANDSNRTVEEKLERLINRSNVGLRAKIIEQDNRSALHMESVSTGVSEKRESAFEIKDNNKSESGNAVKSLGLDRKVRDASNAEFTINGIEGSSVSNTFTINNQFEVTLHADYKDEQPRNVKIGFKADMDAVVDNLNRLVKGFNDIVDLAKEKSDGSFENSKLTRDLRGISNLYKETLESSGLVVDEEGHMNIDEALIVQSEKDGTLNDSLKKYAMLRNALLNKANSIAINPINYVNKKLISYPNPVRSFSNPYVSSIYSGMMFNGYV